MTAAGQALLPMATDVSIPAESAPIGVQLWPTTGPEHAPNFTLEAVEVRRDCNGTAVTWVYESGARRTFRLGELVFCRVAVDALSRAA